MWSVVAALVAGCAEGSGWGAKSGSSIAKQQQKQQEERDKDFSEGANRPATPQTKYAYARVLAARGQYGPCDALLTSVLKEVPNFRGAYLLQAEARMRLRRVDDAISTLRFAMRVFPKDHVLLNNLGICYLMKSDCLSALDTFTLAASLQPDNARYRSNMALALGLLGRKEESVSLYRLTVSGDDAQHNVEVLDAARGAYFGMEPPRADRDPPITGEFKSDDLAHMAGWPEIRPADKPAFLQAEPKTKEADEVSPPPPSDAPPTDFEPPG
jgi:tetratricopeptide (TPR) repeat protein